MKEAKLRPASSWIRLAATLIRRLPAGRYRALKWLNFRRAVPFLMQLPAELGGYWFHCNLRDLITREVCFAGRYEPQETALVQTLLRPGMTFVDVGANWGYFTLLAAHLVGESGHVVSLEPDPRLFPILQQNIRHNGLCQVAAFQVAAADTRGVVALAGYDELDANWGISRVLGKGRQADRRFAVAALPLDELFGRLQLTSIDLLKMDIEGAEGLALAGLANSLRRHRVKRLLLELHPAQLAEHGQSAEEVFDRLHQFGYRIWTVDHSQQMTRRAAYAERLDAHFLLQPLGKNAELDNWPHVLCAVPELEADPLQ